MIDTLMNLDQAEAQALAAHRLTIHSPVNGESSCTCGWSYHVRNFRPMWPMKPEAVDEQVRAAFATHVRIQTNILRRVS